MIPQTPGRPDHAAPERYEVVSPQAIEPKVTAATAGSAAGAALSAFAVWLVDELFYGGERLPPEVPLPVSGLISVAVTGAATWAAGFLARHVNRAD